MTDEKLFELVKRVDPRAVRLPPGIKAIAAEIEKAERERCAKMCEDSGVFDRYDPGGFFARLIRGHVA